MHLLQRCGSPQSQGRFQTIIKQELLPCGQDHLVTGLGIPACQAMHTHSHGDAQQPTMGVQVLISRSQWCRVVSGAMMRKGPRLPCCCRSSSSTAMLCAVFPKPICTMSSCTLRCCSTLACDVRVLRHGNPNSHGAMV